MTRRPEGPADRLRPVRQALPRHAARRSAARPATTKVEPIDVADRRGPGPALGVRQPLRRRQPRRQVRERPLPRHATPTATTGSTRSSCSARSTAAASTARTPSPRPRRQVALRRRRQRDQADRARRLAACRRSGARTTSCPACPTATASWRTSSAPGGCIYQVDPDGKDWELVSIGFRNPFDLAFNRDGDLFTYDSDMEWDINTPWYRPTRVCHAASGSRLRLAQRRGQVADLLPRQPARRPSTSAPARRPASPSATARSSRRSTRRPCSSATGATASSTPST